MIVPQLRLCREAEKMQEKHWNGGPEVQLKLRSATPSSVNTSKTV
jgi:hypothetical protein